MTVRQATLAVWAALGAALAVLQVVSLVSRGSFPGLGALVDRVTRRRAGQVVFVVAWMWLGWHAFAR